MRCTVLFFAQLADAAGVRRLEVELPDGATAEAALTAVFREHPTLSPWRDRVAIAVDERYAKPTTVLNPGAVIALIPPVSGG